MLYLLALRSDRQNLYKLLFKLYTKFTIILSNITQLIYNYRYIVDHTIYVIISY